MKKIQLTKMSFLLIVFLFSCSPKYVQQTYYAEVSWEPYLNDWIGKSEKNVINEFGMPSSSYTSSYGNKILKYTGEKRYHSNSVVIGGIVFNNAVVNQHYIEFNLNNNGLVQSVKANLPPKYESRTRTVQKDNSEAWFYGFMGLLGIAAIVGAAMIGM